jgi:nucleoside-diphosphate-sugar epimerase
MKVVVTGAAGFIGSHLCDRLLDNGHEVAGVDSFSDYYSRTIKERNLDAARSRRSFSLFELDLVEDDLREALEGAGVVFHLAARSGIRPGRRNPFDHYLRDNVVATQRLLDALSGMRLKRFVYGGGWSVYGDAERLPTKESNVPQPLSWDGITKLAGEHLVRQHSATSGLPAVSLRYFTVYGPRQRPDMAVAQFMKALAAGEEIEIFGDGEQTRDFTYISDVVEATVRAATAEVDGMVLNIGGGSRTTLKQVLRSLESITGVTVGRRLRPATAGDQRHSIASINLARRHLNWEPRVSLTEGLDKQWAWFRETTGAKAVPKA